MASFGEYLEVLPPEKLVFTMSIQPLDSPKVAGPVTVAATFEQTGHRTRLTLVTIFRSTSERDTWVEAGAGGEGRGPFDALADHLDEAQANNPIEGVTYFEDRGSLFDAPLETLWDYLEKDQEFHPKAHSSTLRNLEATELSPVTTSISCEVKWGGHWRKMVTRFTSIRPAVRVTEELEGPYAGSRTVYLYTPRGQQTAVDVFCYIRSREHSPSEIKRQTLDSLAKAFEEDTPFVRRFALKHR